MKLLALGVFMGLYLNVAPPRGMCAEAMLDSSTNMPIAIPMRGLTASGGDRNVSLIWQFPIAAGARRLALYVSKASPFVAVRVNRRNLTPEVDLARRDLRHFGPVLLAIPDDALQASENTLVLSMPVSSRLVVTQLGLVCIGEREVLHPVWLANWWRETGVLAVCLALFFVMGLIAVTLALLQRKSKAWYWYIASLLAAAYRPYYLIVGVMPGGADGWRAASDFSILLYTHAVHRLLSQFWSLPAQRWSGRVLLGIALARSIMLLGHIDQHPLSELSYWIATTMIGSALVVDVARRAQFAPAIERKVLAIALCFVILSALLNVVTAYRAIWSGMQWIYPLGTLVLSMSIGFLLVRRTTMGARLLAQAMHMLGARLDDALPDYGAAGARIWRRVASELAVDERQRMLGVIEDGFGTRMLDVLVRIRQEHPRSRLGSQVQRALLDLRLMIDAIDSSCQSIAAAFALLRQRMNGPLAAVGIQCRWELAGVGDWQIESRRKLTDLFRCMEELISNIIQHAQARAVRIVVQTRARTIAIDVEDDGRGIATTQGHGRGLSNLRQRMAALGGTFRIESRADGTGTCAQLRLPRF